jgi:DNA-directed RNA polymerase specialized sigma24 family protein
VVRFVSFRANRLYLRRRDHEKNSSDADASGSDAIPSQDEVGERLETQRHLTDAVFQLDEPCRSVVYLHFYEGLKLVEIAGKLGASDSTVRTQLSRGLERLGSRMSTDTNGRRRDLRAALLPLIFPPEFFRGGAVPSWVAEPPPPAAVW